MTTQYQAYEWLKVHRGLRPRCGSGSLRGLLSDIHAATNPCHWAIVDTHSRSVVRAKSDADAKTITTLVLR